MVMMSSGLYDVIPDVVPAMGGNHKERIHNLKMSLPAGGGGGGGGGGALVRVICAGAGYITQNKKR